MSSTYSLTHEVMLPGAKQDILHSACSKPIVTHMLTHQTLAVVCRNLTKTW